MVLLVSNSNAYERPSKELAQGKLRFYIEQGLVDTDLSTIFSAAQECAENYDSAIHERSTVAFAESVDAQKAAATVVHNSIQPIPISIAQVSETIRDVAQRAKSSQPNLQTQAFPEVHVWTKKSVGKMFEVGDAPPGFAFDAKTREVRQTLYDESGRLLALTILVDTTMKPEDQLQFATGLFKAWLRGVLDAEGAKSYGFTFRVVRDSTRGLLASVSVPGWFKVGLADQIACDATGAIYGDESAHMATDLILGPRTSISIRSALQQVGKVDAEKIPTNLERVVFESIRAAQENTDRALVRVALGKATKANASFSTEQVIEEYRSLAKAQRDLFSR